MLLKKPPQNRAFKNLLSYVCASAATISPLLITAGVMNHIPDSTGGFLLTAFSLCLGAFAQGSVLRHRKSDNSLANPHAWKNLFSSHETHSQKKYFDQLMLSVRHLGIVKNASDFKPAHYQAIAGISLGLSLNELDLKQWVEGVVDTKSDYSYYSERDLLQKIGVTQLRMYVRDVTIKMDPQQLALEMRRQIQQQKASTNIEKENTLDYLLYPSPRAKQNPQNQNKQRVNEVVYARAQFFKDNAITPPFFTPSDYQTFAKVFARGQTHPQEFIKPLIGFLEKNKKSVDWQQLSNLFETHFKGDVDFYKKTMSDIAYKIEAYQKDYEQSVITTKAHDLSAQTPIDLNHQNRISSTSLSSENSPHQSKPNHPKSLESCGFIYYKAEHFPEQWAELKDCYETLIEHQHEIPHFELMKVQQSLNACLPTLVKSDINLSTFPHESPEVAKELIIDNLELALVTVKSALQTIDQSLIKELRTTKNYQTMKMNSK